MLTLGELREMTRDLPDDAIVLIQDADGMYDDNVVVHSARIAPVVSTGRVYYQFVPKVNERYYDTVWDAVVIS